jgi:glutaredoxin
MGDIVIYYASVSSSLKIKKDIQYATCLLDAKNVAYTKIDVSLDPRVLEKMHKGPGKKALPQIWVDGKYIGVCHPLTHSLHPPTHY